MRHIALLRGVNVGGKNTLPMPALAAALGARGFSRVQTYINSGNLLFDSDAEDEAMLQADIQALIREEFGIDTPVAVFSAEELAKMLDQAPPWWNGDRESKHNAIFVIPPMTAEEAMRAVGEAKPEYEQVAAAGRVIFWSAPLKTFGRTRWSKVVGSSVYGSITIRNANTAMKLLVLARG